MRRVVDRRQAGIGHPWLVLRGHPVDRVQVRLLYLPGDREAPVPYHAVIHLVYESHVGGGPAEKSSSAAAKKHEGKGINPWDRSILTMLSDSRISYNFRHRAGPDSKSMSNGDEGEEEDNEDDDSAEEDDDE
jgi:hypothetical protein